MFEEDNIKKEDTEKKSRILGMLCQSSEWINFRNFDIVIRKDENDYSCFEDLS